MVARWTKLSVKKVLQFNQHAHLQENTNLFAVILHLFIAIWIRKLVV